MAKKEKIMTPPWIIKTLFHCSLVLFFVGGLATVAIYEINGGSRRTLVDERKEGGGGFANSSISIWAKCDLFSGHWVFDNKSNYDYPLYKEKQCSFMFGDLACTQFGRLDSKYQHWRWQPHGCDLPRFDAKKLLERLRGKRLVFVGDSINRNQWVSLVCMLEASIPPRYKSRKLNGSLYTFKAEEYNASVDFYWAPLLVESNSDDPSKHRVDDRVLRVGSIEKHARNWADADVLIFNSYLWWRVPTLKVLNGTFDDLNPIYKKVNNRRCYKMALRTWANWLGTHINRTKTQVFFVSMSATHHKGYEWGMRSDQTCLNETEPITKERFWESGSDPKMMRILESSLSKLRAKGVNVQILNITQLTQYRKDAHPSIYRKQWRPLPKEKLSNPQSYADCTHWCLPGVPDIWNELLATHCFYGAMVMAAVYLTEDENGIVEREEGMVTGNSSFASCDLFSGNWVFDNKSISLYYGKKCPFLTDDYACEKFGRKDFKFQHWRWQPLGCNLPRFNGTELLEKLRNKRVVFVGDSLGKNQWVSLICMIDSWILDPTLKHSQWHGSLITFKAMEYNASIDFYWEPLLVESNCDDPIIHRVHDRIIRVDSIEDHAMHWIDADMLVFDSYMWWLEPNMTLLWGSFENPNRTYVESSPMRCFEMALKTWSNWLDVHVNRTKTRLFFTTLSPYHKMAYFWGGDEEKNCYNETEPILKERYIRDVTDIAMMEIAGAAIDEMKTKGFDVQVLNITELSTYRKDAHPSIYRKYWQPPIEQELADPAKAADCVHWCLPGVPDVWNQIFYSYIFHCS